MATPRLFKLKSQMAPAPNEAAAREFPFAKIWVDTGVFHLDEPYDYLVPEKFSFLVNVGVRVQVPFGNREVEGIVLQRCNDSNASGPFRSLTKVLSPHPVATPSTLALIKAVADNWATNPWDVIRSAIPARIASIDKLHRYAPGEFSEGASSQEISFRSFQPHVDPITSTAAIAIDALSRGSVLIVAPDDRDISAFAKALSEVGDKLLRIDSGVARSERYAAFLKTFNPGNHIIIGARNSIFAPLPKGSTIIVYKEASPDLYEVRSPGWNARDIAIMRSSLDSVHVILSGYVPSLDVSALIDSKTIRFYNTSAHLNVKAFSSVDSSLLPGRIFSDIRTALRKGPVLFVLPRKGYANALLCAHCKNLALCSCGGKLQVSAKEAEPMCRICGEKFSEWQCSFCHRDKRYVVSRGIERAAEEISRAFPNIPLVLSYGDVIKESVESKPSLVLTTPGAAPRVVGGYSAVVILEGLTYFAHNDLRATERASELFFETAAMTSEDGNVLLSIDQTHPIVASLIRWNPSSLLKRELKQREEIFFPPIVNSSVLELPSSQATSLATGISKAISEGRLGSGTRILGPSKVDSNLSKIVILNSFESQDITTKFMHELMRRRSIARKSDATLRINPYSL